MPPADHGSCVVPPELALDLPDELADLGRGGLRLFALHTEQQLGVVAVEEPHLDRAIGEQRRAYDRRKQNDVFAKQPATRLGRRVRPRLGRGAAVIHSMPSLYGVAGEPATGATQNLDGAIIR